MAGYDINDPALALVRRIRGEIRGIDLSNWEAAQEIKQYARALLPPEGETRVLGMSVRIDRSLAPDEIRIEHSGADTLRIIGIGQPELTAAPTPAQSREDEALGGLIESWQRFADEAPSSYALVAARVRDKFIPELRAALRSCQSPQAVAPELDVYNEVYSLLADMKPRFEEVARVQAELFERFTIKRKAAAPQPSPQGEDAKRPSIDDIARVGGAVDFYAKRFQDPAANNSWRRIKTYISACLAASAKDEGKMREALRLAKELLDRAAKDAGDESGSGCPFECHDEDCETCLPARTTKAVSAALERKEEE